MDLARVQAARIPELHWKFEFEAKGEPLAVLMQLAVVQNRLKTVNVFLNNERKFEVSNLNQSQRWLLRGL